MEGNICQSFQFCKIAKGLWDSIKGSYAQKQNHARIYQLTRDLATLNQVRP